MWSSNWLFIKIILIALFHFLQGLLLGLKTEWYNLSVDLHKGLACNVGVNKPGALWYWWGYLAVPSWETWHTYTSTHPRKESHDGPNLVNQYDFIEAANRSVDEGSVRGTGMTQRKLHHPKEHPSNPKPVTTHRSTSSGAAPVLVPAFTALDRFIQKSCNVFAFPIT